MKAAHTVLFIFTRTCDKGKAKVRILILQVGDSGSDLEREFLMATTLYEVELALESRHPGALSTPSEMPQQPPGNY